MQRLFPLLSVSVGALVCDQEAVDLSAEDLSYHLAPLKLRAKTRPGNAIEVERYADIVGGDSAAWRAGAASA